MRRVPAPLAILLAVATIQFLAWVVVLPALQPPDEHTHFAYTQRLLETGHKPPIDGDPPRYSPELEAAWIDAGLKPMIGNVSGRPYWTSLDERLWQAHDAQARPARPRRRDRTHRRLAQPAALLRLRGHRLRGRVERVVLRSPVRDADRQPAALPARRS